MGCSPWGLKQSDMTEQLNTTICIIFHFFYFHVLVFVVHAFCLVRYTIPKYFILFDVMLDGIISLISVSDLLVLVCRNITHFLHFAF